MSKNGTAHPRGLLALLVALLAAAYTLSGYRVQEHADAGPTVVLISVDGFRADYMDLYKPPNLNRLAADGVRAEYLEPVFPTKTFPNHYTLVTGQFPARHGIISNSMYDPEFRSNFSLGNRSAVSNGRWWGGEPLWVTVQKHGRTSAAYFWPGSEAEIQGYRPTHWIPYDAAMPHAARVDSVLAALQRTPRPALVTLYFSTVDTQGHRYGPESDAVRAAVAEVDRHIGQLVHRLEEINLLNAVNLVVVSDHGMAETSNDRLLALDEFVPMDQVYIVELGPVAMLNVKASGNLERILGDLKRMSNVTWYTKEEIPPALEFRNHRRIPDLVGIAAEGWRVERSVQVRGNPPSRIGGTHGYEPSVESMRALFIARGPAFRRGFESEGFAIIHVYELLCEVLDVTPAENDGDLTAVQHLLK